MARSEVKQSLNAQPWDAIRHPAVAELTRRELRLGRFGVTLFVISQAIPYFVLVNVRWMLAGSYVPPGINHWIGGLLPTIFLVIGIPFAWFGVRANLRGQKSGLQGWFTVNVVLGVAAVVTLLVALSTYPLGTLSHYGSIYVTCLGVAVFYTIISTIVMLGVIFRCAAGLISARTPFGPESAAVTWTFNAIAWFALYMALYVI
ncbi:hypothetical protein [Alicyclobacillus mengziensis]|uniref:Heme-copper oxidase subunit III family profile domain-containing protein n=1 Tax=Alicyclobacillus mengziensis TaxID=2931921 RepID=A0A9X7VWV3_9BACL|nr:hypothetical protein [Alicyclobacillus mengziensis]QSO46541.1 hypothetical protein JZ786_19060 [Alicyclobacillus mengziensis]